MNSEKKTGGQSSYWFGIVTSLCVIFGLQFLRILLPAFVYYLRDSRGVGSLTLAPIALAVFALGLLAIPILRWLGSRVAMGIAVVGLAIVRVLAQFSTQAAVDLVLSLAGATLFAFFLVYACSLARRSGNGGLFAFFFLLGVSLDTAIFTAAGSLDLVWQFETVPILIVLILALLLAVAFRFLLSSPELAGLEEVSWGKVWPLIAIGPWIFLQLLLYQNVARTAALSGFTLPLAGMLVAVGNLVGLALALWFSRSKPPSSLVIGLLGLLLILAALPHESTGWLGVGATVAGQLISFLLLAVLFFHLGEGESSKTLSRTGISVVVGMEIFVLCAFLYYASIDIALGFRAPVVPPVAAFLVAIPIWVASRRPIQEPAGGPRLSYSLLWLGVLLLVFPAYLWIVWQVPAPVQPPAGGTPLQVMTYNLHQGYGAEGRMDLEEQVREMENSGADIIALQEVSRGSLINGSTDMIEWLSQQLGMPYIFGPTLGPLWGNAVLSRYPILDYRLHSLPPDDLLIRRGYIDADIEAGPSPVRVLATHLHHLEPDTEIRQGQVQAILRGWNGTPRTILLGDMNARPEDPEMVMLAQAGFSDTLAGVGAPGNYTFYSADPYQHIDYIWLTPDFTLQDAFVPQLTASDHLPVVAQVETGN